MGRRDNNEDAVLVDSDAGLFAVADGVGGHLAGEIASRITCSVLQARVAAGDTLAGAIEAADRAVRDAVDSGEGRAGMASTVVAVQRDGGGANIAWVGDSRAYLWDGARLSLLTRDHSLVATLVARGEITPEQAAQHPRRNVILQALGQRDAEALDISTHHYQELPGGLLLLCSDGLSDVVPPAQLAALLSGMNTHTIDFVAEALLNAALEAGGRDNISLILVQLDGAAAPGKTATENSVWTFDPQSGRFDGLPAPAVASSGESDVTRILPRGALEDPAVDITVPEKREQLPGTRWVWVLGALALAALIMTLAFFYE